VLTDANRHEQNRRLPTYKTPHLFPAGTILLTIRTTTIAATSTTLTRPRIGWGSRTMDEMGHG
jgi:hypothetical protein